jgi:TonB family protein
MKHIFVFAGLFALIVSIIMIAPGRCSAQNTDKTLEVPPPDSVAFDKAPEAVKQIMPKYPESALRDGTEGTVYVKLWVSKRGTVKQALIVKSEAEVFNQAAIDAAMKWKFKPALQKNRPVDVWIMMPFKFKLKDGQK